MIGKESLPAAKYPYQRQSILACRKVQLPEVMFNLPEAKYPYHTVVTSILSPSIVDLDSILIEIQEYLNNYLPFYWDFPFHIPLHFHLYLHITLLVFCPWYSVNLLVFYDPSWIGRENSLYLLSWEKLLLTLSQKLHVSFVCILLVQVPLPPLHMGS